jgi:stringent starvation protein B
MTKQLPAKLDVFRALLTRGDVFVHVDPRYFEVILPQRLKMQAQVVLQFGLDLSVPIPDMEYNEECLSGTLSFKGVKHWCEIPWYAVFALVGEDAKGLVWEDVMPAEVQAQAERERLHAEHNVKELRKYNPRNTRAKVSGKPGADRSHLRLVR